MSMLQLSLKNYLLDKKLPILPLLAFKIPAEASPTITCNVQPKIFFSQYAFGAAEIHILLNPNYLAL